jgi:hypothetical protein
VGGRKQAIAHDHSSAVDRYRAKLPPRWSPSAAIWIPPLPLAGLILSIISGSLLLLSVLRSAISKVVPDRHPRGDHRRGRDPNLFTSAKAFGWHIGSAMALSDGAAGELIVLAPPFLVDILIEADFTKAARRTQPAGGLTKAAFTPDSRASAAANMVRRCSVIATTPSSRFVLSCRRLA